jgi:hypothetical protein
MKAASLMLATALSGLGMPASAQAPSASPLRIAPPPAAGGMLVTPEMQAQGVPPGPTVYGPMVVTPDLCQRLAQRPRQGGVPPAAYQPGVDVYGRPVAPADLPSSDATPSITTEIELGRLGGRAAAGGVMKGYVTLQPDGSVLLDGQPLPSSQEYGLLDICRQQRLIP